MHLYDNNLNNIQRVFKDKNTTFGYKENSNPTGENIKLNLFIKQQSLMTAAVNL